MPRFSSVQAFTDSQSSSRAISYDQAKGNNTSGSVRAEKVYNPSSSVAGAGSSSFHIYRHARAREMERLKGIEASDMEQKKDFEFQQELEKNQQEEEERTAKRRKKRKRQKEAKLRKKNFAKLGVLTTDVKAVDKDVEEEEFTYNPEEDIADDAAATEESQKEKTIFPNDGSFLEMMKKQLEKESSEKILDEETETRLSSEEPAEKTANSTDA